GIERGSIPLPRHPELVSGSIVQSTNDSERSEFIYFAQGEMSKFISR
ncbi:hypothetical protein PL2TA16_02604, partial [Pseudoalteromonas luteoviolacea 2ta16]